MIRDWTHTGLYRNGAEDPDRWSPNPGVSVFRRHVEVGDLIGWRYGAWRVVEVRFREDVDLTAEDRADLEEHVSRFKAEFQAKARAERQTVVLCHESGPLLLPKGWKVQRLHDGRKTIHVSTTPAGMWSVIPEPYMTCSCHGHIWPCQEIDQAVLASVKARELDRLIATTEPGVCAHCLEPITTRQKWLTFPEPSRLMPGAPGPTFHSGRAACWAGAEAYERNGRLADDPFVARLASCPGVRFLHEARDLPGDRRIECTAGPECTGHHGPAGYRQDLACWHRYHYDTSDGGYARPLTDCGYRSGDRHCLAGGPHVDGSTATNAIVGDVIWAANHSSRGRLL